MFRQFRLKNGVRVFLEPHVGNKHLAIAVGAPGGTIHDPPDKVGLAHWLEHILFKSNEFRKTQDIVYTIERRCGGLYNNAGTSATSIVLACKVLAEDAAEALSVYGEIIRSVSIDEEEALLERDLVVDEHRGVDETPRTYLMDRLFCPRLFSGTRLARYWRENQESVAALKLDDALALKRQRFVPEELFVCAAGGMDAPRLLEEIESYFGGLVPSGMRFRISRSPVSSRTPSIEPHPEVLWGDRMERAYIAQGWRVPPPGHEDAVALTILWWILGYGMSSWVFQRIREERGIGYDPEVMYMDFGIGAVFYALVGTPQDRLAETHAILEQMFQDVRMVDEATVDGTKRLLKSKHLDQRDNLLSRIEFAAARACGERVLDSEEFLAALEWITPEILSRVAQKYVSQPPLCMHLLPGTRNNHSS